ncbi:MAG: 50S ribosomal protein L18 [Parcubacteria group bacterium]|nr:50S ribosomal protein L18 [Parcubacteria group bacterium]
MKQQKSLNDKRLRRKARTRAKIFGTAERPRLSLFRSNRNIFVQLIDDMAAKTLVAASTKEIRASERKGGKTAQAVAVASLLMKRAGEKSIKSAVFDRGSYAYHGRVKAIAEVLRKEGLKI